MSDYALTLIIMTLGASVAQLLLACAALVRQWAETRRAETALRLIEAQAAQAKRAAQSAHDVSLANAVAIEEVRAHIADPGNHTS